MPLLEGFRFMERMWDPANSTCDQTETREHESLPRFDPLEGKDLRPACLTLLLGCYSEGVYSDGVD
jgi:hypothetical protein